MYDSLSSELARVKCVHFLASFYRITRLEYIVCSSSEEKSHTCQYTDLIVNILT